MAGEGDRTFTDIRLTEWTSCGGCAAKWGASLLSDLVSELPAGFDPSLLVGLAPFDDAAVYRITDDVALVSTTDFFPPLVDDPEDFGAIAAANACSRASALGLLGPPAPPLAHTCTMSSASTVATLTR